MLLQLTSLSSHLDFGLRRRDQNDNVKYVSNCNILILKVRFQWFSFLQTYLAKFVRHLSPVSHSLTWILLVFISIDLFFNFF